MIIIYLINIIYNYSIYICILWYICIISYYPLYFIVVYNYVHTDHTLVHYTCLVEAAGYVHVSHLEDVQSYMYPTWSTCMYPTWRTYMYPTWKTYMYSRWQTYLQYYSSSKSVSCIDLLTFSSRLTHADIIASVTSHSTSILLNMNFNINIYNVDHNISIFFTLIQFVFKNINIMNCQNKLLYL